MVLTANFNPPGGENVTTWDWFDASGTIAGATDQPTLSVTTTGTYHVEYTTDGGGPYVGDDFDVVARPLVSTTVSGTTSFCTGGSVTFDISAAAATANDPGTTYEWFRGGTTSVGNSSSYVATASGSYTITATDPTSGCTKTSANPRVVTVYTYPDATISPAGPVCAGANLSVATGAGYKYTWTKDGAPAGGKSEMKNAVAGSYSVTVSNHNCATTSASSVTVKPNPAKPIITGISDGCSNVARTLSTSAAEDHYQWKKGTSNVGTDVNNLAVNSTGSYTVTVSSDGCSATSAAFKYTATVAPTATATSVTGNTDLDAGVVKLTANGGAGLSYDWKLDGVSQLTGRTIFATDAGDWTVTTTRGCCSETSSAVTVTGGMARFANPQEETSVIESSDVVVYPNPSTGIYNISAAEAVNATVRDMQGRVITNIKSATQVDLSGYANGLYLMQITNVDGKVLSSVRLIKQ